MAKSGTNNMAVWSHWRPARVEIQVFEGESGKLTKDLTVSGVQLTTACFITIDTELSCANVAADGDRFDWCELFTPGPSINCASQHGNCS